MKIKLFGTGSLTAKNFSACALIEDTILFDCPNGLVKRLRQAEVDLRKLRVVIISHYHADHDWDLPFLLLEKKKMAPKESLTVIAPKGYKERYKVVFDIMWAGAFDYEMMNDCVEILEATDKKQFEIDGYKIKAFKMLHVNCDAYGYRIERDGKVAAFTGDSAMCDNVIQLIEKADAAFVDATGSSLMGIGQVHFSLEDLIQLRNKVKVRIIPIHMNDAIRENLEKIGFELPNDGDVMEL
jgi:ribonuclease BN (tRNA processing enzyme)